MKEAENTVTIQGVEGNVRQAGIDRRSFVGMVATAGMTLLLGGALAGCSSRQEAATSAGSASSTQQEASEPAEQTQDATQVQPTGGKTLVAVFSWSGNTLQMAERISDLTGGDLFRIEPAAPYTQDYNEVLDIAQAEQREDARPALAATVDSWDEYDTVFLGYPVWWYEPPPDHQDLRGGVRLQRQDRGPLRHERRLEHNGHDSRDPGALPRGGIPRGSDA